MECLVRGKPCSGWLKRHWRVEVLLHLLRRLNHREQVRGGVAEGGDEFPIVRVIAACVRVPRTRRSRFLKFPKLLDGGHVQPYPAARSLSRIHQLTFDNFGGGGVEFGMVLSATPYTLPNCLRVTYASSHWWEEGTGTIRERIAARIKAEPSWAYLVDTEKSRDTGRIADVVEVLKALADLNPLAERFVYDSKLRVTTRSQADAAKAEIVARSGNRDDQEMYSWCTAVARDVYLMGELVGTRWDVNHPVSGYADNYLSLNAEVMAHEYAVNNVSVWPCIHERYHTGHGCGENIWIPRAYWRSYVAKVRAQWPDYPIFWWSGAMASNPGRKEGWVWPSEHDLKQYAEDLG